MDTKKSLPDLTPKAQPLTEPEFENLRVGGMEVNYFVVCPRKLWLYAHRLQLERESDRVELGRLLHENSYERERKRELLIDELIKIDVMEEASKIVEVKHSRKMKEASRMQVLYYLYYIKRKGLGELTGELRFPKQRKREEVKLTPEAESEVEQTLRELEQVKNLPTPPEPDWKGICRACAYAEFCWG